MDKIEIVGRNKPIHNCLDCGAELSYKEYHESKDRCYRCRVVLGRGKHKEFTSSTGQNNVDAILIHKREEN